MLNRELRIKLIQDNIVWGDVDANLMQLQSTITEISESIDLIVLPELCPTGFITTVNSLVEDVVVTNTGKTIQTFKEIARKHK